MNRTTRYNCRFVTGFTSDFLSFIVVEHTRFFHRAIQLSTHTAAYTAHAMPANIEVSCVADNVICQHFSDLKLQYNNPTVFDMQKGTWQRVKYLKSKITRFCFEDWSTVQALVSNITYFELLIKLVSKSISHLEVWRYWGLQTSYFLIL